ncbi:SHOCT domain-containing protein [Massilia niabensis]|uniref:SHOCT domain-containing protein n=1 Tax=Massilia niabensis TaxID=544910 RepID=A0ABW0L307_9BURK
MQQLSPTGQQTIDDIAKRYGYSTDAVLSLLQSVINGNGSMAQFNHPEFAGSGQWMRGGMTMVSDMFNNNLKSSINNLCSELSQLIASQPDFLRSGGFQSQNQGGQQQNSYSGGNGDGMRNDAPVSSASLFVSPAFSSGADWWGAGLRWPNSTGAQNGVRYAYFAQARRLAIELNGRVTIYDTLDHQIGGFSQQQSYGGSLSFNSQHGLIDVARLPVVSIDGVAQGPESGHAKPAAPAVLGVAAQRPDTGNVVAELDIFATIDKLAELRSRNILTEAEFETKKAELLARL